MATYLPEEVLYEILSRLPVKKLIQFRCVSKRWCSLISTPTFISHHLKKSTEPTNENNQLFLFRYFAGLPEEGKERYLLYPDGNFPSSPTQEFDCPFSSRRFNYVNIVGSCNGVVCLADDLVEYTHRYVLWNPNVRKAVSVVKPNVTFESHGPFMHSLGFGFDSVSDDYKLVRVIYLRSFTNGYDETPLVEVYSLRSQTWRMVEYDLECFIVEHSLSVFMKGACHWVANAPHMDDFHRTMIVWFSLENEVFGKMDVPDCLAWENAINSSVAVRDGCLSLVPFNRGFGKEFYSVWVMKEYGVADSWIKLFDIENLTRLPRLVAFGKDDLVLLAEQNGNLMSCHPQNEEHRDAIAKGEVGSFYYDRFMESLVLLDKADGILEENPVGDKADETSKEHSCFVASADERRDRMKKGKKKRKFSYGSDLSNVAICRDGCR